MSEIQRVGPAHFQNPGFRFPSNEVHTRWAGLTGSGVGKRGRFWPHQVAQSLGRRHQTPQGLGEDQYCSVVFEAFATA